MRDGQIEALRTLPLKEPELVKLREACVAAHAGLVDAERQQAQVRARLDAAGPNDRLQQSELAKLGESLAKAGEQLRKANEAVPDCEARTRELVKQYR